MKMMLSMPSTISSIVSVNRAIHASGCVIHSMSAILGVGSEMMANYDVASMTDY